MCTRDGIGRGKFIFSDRYGAGTTCSGGSGAAGTTEDQASGNGRLLASKFQRDPVTVARAGLTDADKSGNPGLAGGLVNVATLSAAVTGGDGNGHATADADECPNECDAKVCGWGSDASGPAIKREH